MTNTTDLKHRLRKVFEQADRMFKTADTVFEEFDKTIDQFDEVFDDPSLRHEMGEGWVICKQCNAKLYSYDLPPNKCEDVLVDCPHRNKLRMKVNEYFLLCSL